MTGISNNTILLEESITLEGSLVSTRQPASRSFHPELQVVVHRFEFHDNVLKKGKDILKIVVLLPTAILTKLLKLSFEPLSSTKPIEHKQIIEFHPHFFHLSTVFVNTFRGDFSR